MAVIIMARPLALKIFMRIITVNLSGIRSATGRGFREWRARRDEDVVCLQELNARAAGICIAQRFSDHAPLTADER